STRLARRRPSRRVSFRLTGDCVSAVACAARVKLCSWATSVKARTASISRVGGRRIISYHLLRFAPSDKGDLAMPMITVAYATSRSEAGLKAAVAQAATDLAAQ